MENKTLTSDRGTIGSHHLQVGSIGARKKQKDGLAFKGVLNKNNVLKILLLSLVVPIALYYLWTRGFIYLNFTREVYTDYFWSRAPWLLVHVVCGLVATLIGPIQFIPLIRLKWPLLHRRLGKTYLGCIVLSTFVSFYLISATEFGGVVYTVGLTSLGVVWLSTTLMAYLCIVRRNIQMHKEWMIKSYVLTVAFVSFRFVEDLMAMFDFSNFTERKVLMTWACWAIPFVATEVVLQMRKLYKQKLF